MKLLFVVAVLFGLLSLPRGGLTLRAPSPQAATDFPLVKKTRLGDNWGTNIHWTKENAPGAAAMLSQGFKVVRMDCNWGSIEHTCGQYDFSAYDHLLAVMKNHSLRPYWILDYGNRCYPGTNGPNSCDTKECIQAYGRFVAAVGNHFEGEDIIFENTNEPNGMGQDNATVLAALDRSAGKQLDSAGANFVGPATAGIDFPYIQQAFKHGLLQAPLTGVSVHAYRPSPPETSIHDWRHLRSLVDNYTATSTNDTLSEVPLINGEWGYSTGTECKNTPAVNETTQGKYIPRMWLSSLIGGANISIDYDWQDDGCDKTRCQQNFGSVGCHYTGNPVQPFNPKPAFLAARAIQQTVGNCIAVAEANLTSRMKVVIDDGRGSMKAETDYSSSSLGFVPPPVPMYHSSNWFFGISFQNEGTEKLSYAFWGVLPDNVSIPVTIAMDDTSCADDGFTNDMSSKGENLSSSWSTRPRCWNTTSVFGEDLGLTCCEKRSSMVDRSSTYQFTINVTNGPMYLH